MSPAVALSALQTVLLTTLRLLLAGFRGGAFLYGVGGEWKGARLSWWPDQLPLSVALWHLTPGEFLESSYPVNVICGVCKVLGGTRGRRRGISMKGSGRAPELHEQDRGERKGPRDLLKTSVPIQISHMEKLGVIMPEGHCWGSRFSVTFPVISW